jgi:hypothetical protein
MTFEPLSTTDATRLVHLCWKRYDGSVFTSLPLAYRRAEALGLAYSEMHAEGDYWLHAIPGSGRLDAES